MSEGESYYTDDPVKCPFFFCEIVASAVLSVALIPPPTTERKPTALAESKLEVSQPTQEEAQALLWINEGKGFAKKRDWHKNAERQLRGREYFGFCFEMASGDLLTVGERHDTLKRWVASATTLLRGVEGTTPAHVYAIFLPPVLQVQAEDESDARDWQRELWRLVEWTWTQEMAAEAQKAKEEKVAQIQVVEAGDSLIAGVRAWNPNLPASPPEAMLWIRKRMIVHLGELSFVMTPSGRYSAHPVKTRSLIPHIKHLGMSQFIPLTTETPAGGQRMLSPQEIESEHAVVASREEVEPEIEGGYLLYGKGATPILKLPSYRLRDDLEPMFVPAVDGWLQTFGGRDYDRLNRHIGCNLNFKHPVAAMNIIAAMGAGKKLFVQAHKLCLENPKMASEHDLSEDFNTGLWGTPFLNCNEGGLVRWRKSNPGDTFRKLVTGDDVTVNRKHRDAITVMVYMRIFFTANNDSVILQLCEGRNLAPEDREAIAVRLCSYMPGRAPTDYLRQLRKTTGTKGWISGDPRDPKALLVPRHFLWLYEKYGKNAQPTDEHGLLLAGDPHDPIIHVMRAQGGSAPTVVEALVGLLGQSVLGRGINVKEGKLYVTAAAILAWWRENLTKGAVERLTLRRVADALKGLVVGGHSQKFTIARQEAHWNEVDIPFLATTARSFGLGCPRLDALEQEQLAARAAGTGNGHGGHQVPAEVGL